MPPADRNLVAGTKLLGNYKNETSVCSVEGGADGKLIYVLQMDAFQEHVLSSRSSDGQEKRTDCSGA